MRTLHIQQDKESCLAELEKLVPKPESRAMDKQAEYYFIKMILSSYWDKVDGKYSHINFLKHGFDIEICGENKTINIELKASREKVDYFNKNGAKAILYGNALKHKDIDMKTGLLRADFLVVAAQVRVDDDEPFDYWIFSRDDLSELFPASTIFMPGHISSMMIDLKISHVTDEFNAFIKGVYRIILPIYNKTDRCWTMEYPIGSKHSFEDTWCPLIDEEHIGIKNACNKVIGKRGDINWLFSHINTVQLNVNFGKRTCPYYEAATSNKKCEKCKDRMTKKTIL